MIAQAILNIHAELLPLKEVDWIYAQIATRKS